MSKKDSQHNDEYPPGVVTSVADLMRYEYYVQESAILPKNPVFSLLAGRHQSRLRGRGLDFEEVRPYVPGDDIRNIDWKVTARTGVTHSKVFNEEKERPTFFIVDQSSAMFFGSVKNVKSVMAAQLAALAAFYTIKRGDRAGGLVYNDTGYELVMPRRSKEHVLHLLQSVVAMNKVLPQRTAIVTDASRLSSMLQMARSVITHDYVITVISDLSAISDESRGHLRSMAMHNDVILAHITDPMDSALPPGRYTLSDGKKQILWQNDRRESGKHFEAAYEDMKLSLVASFRSYRIPVVFIDTATAVEDQIIQFFMER